MEHLSGPEKPSPESVQPTYVRPPGLEFAMGVALFAVVLMVFFLLQSGVFISGVLERSPELAKDFTLNTLSDPRMEQRMNELVFNGDLVAQEALWSGLICTVMILVMVRLWKHGHMSSFLGLKIPTAKQFFLWLGVFMLLGLAIEGLSYVSPAFRTDFMEKVIGSTTNLLWLYIGVGIMAPLFEEFLLRGLLFGAIRHMADEHATVAMTAGVFTLMHMQYDWTVMLLILPMGAVLGYARSRSNSIWVPVVLHMLNNLVSVVLP